MFENVTRNQHYISQSEQRLNSINPKVKKEKQKIYEFKVIDRSKLLLSTPRVKNIKRNLAVRDLFSFWIENEKDKNIFLNFENFFKIYEDKISSNTKSLMKKILSKNIDCKEELRNILCGKLMNYFRNPFCIKEHLLKLKETFEGLRPTNEELYSYFKKIDNTNTDLTQICSHLGVSREEYLDWIKIIFIMFSINYDNNGRNLLEMLVDEIVLNPYSIPSLFVFYYDKEICLLSDKGQCNYALDKDFDCFQFNLSAKCFASFVYGNIKDRVHEYADGFPHKEEFIKHWESSKEFKIKFELDELGPLKDYNQRILFSCHENCYSASSNTPLGCFSESS